MMGTSHTNITPALFLQSRQNPRIFNVNTDRILSEPEEQKVVLAMLVGLQATLEVRKLIEIFYIESCKVVDYVGLAYRFDRCNLALEHGEVSDSIRHYQLEFNDTQLGELIVAYGQSPKRQQEKAFDVLLSTLICPLKNAIMHDRIASDAQRDILTGVFNRGVIESALKREVGLSRRYEQPLSLLMIDIDHFKSINDQYGHIAGDQTLKSVASKLTDCIRSTDILSRYGGDEFVLILSNTDIEGALILAERIRCAVEQMVCQFDDGVEVSVTVSIGVESCKGGDEESQEIFKLADSALYQAKSKGRNCVAYLKDRQKTVSNKTSA